MAQRLLGASILAAGAAGAIYMGSELSQTSEVVDSIQGREVVRIYEQPIDYCLNYVGDHLDSALSEVKGINDISDSDRELSTTVGYWDKQTLWFLGSLGVVATGWAVSGLPFPGLKTLNNLRQRA